MSRASFVKTLLTTTAFVGALGASSQAFAVVVADFLIPGTVCQPTQGFASCADYSQYGVHNTCSDPIVVDCPLPISMLLPFPGTNAQWWASIGMYDRSTTADVSCTLQAIDGYGEVYFQTTASSTLGGPGSGAQGVLTTNAFLPATQWHLRCWIPGVEAAGWYSHVSGFKIGYR